MRIALEKKLVFRKAGERVAGRLAEPIYAFDRMVIPAGSVVLGKVARYDPVSRKQRWNAVLSGDFTPLKQAQVEFDTLVMPDGRRLPIDTAAAPGTKFVIQSRAKAKNQTAKNGRLSQVETAVKDRINQQISARSRGAIDVIKSPGKLEKLEEMAVSRLPYHWQWLPAGTRFDAELLKPLEFGQASIPNGDLASLGTQAPAPGSIMFARLLSPLNSETTKLGAPVEAVLTQPLFGADHHLVFPESSLLKGIVVQVKPARRFHRSGQLRYVFESIAPPSGPAQSVRASLESTQADQNSHLVVDKEGGVRTADSKSRYVTPVLSILLASLSADPHQEAGGAAEDSVGAQAGAGGIGFGVLGAMLAQSSRLTAAGFGYTSAAWSFYRGFIARGLDVHFAHNAPMTIRLGDEPSRKKMGDAAAKPLFAAGGDAL